jgi:hypothetical protein
MSPATVDVPPKLSADVRVYATGQGRKTDATNAHSIALVGTSLLVLPGIGPSGGARPLVEVGDTTRFPTATTSRPGPAPHRSMPPPVTTSDTGSHLAGTERSTEPCT